VQRRERAVPNGVIRRCTVAPYWQSLYQYPPGDLILFCFFKNSHFFGLYELIYSRLFMSDHFFDRIRLIWFTTR
jgi:hypothetical protein